MPKIVDKNAKKINIVHAAAKVFAEKGVVKTKMIDIAEEAGIGKGTIYEYYRSKEEIFADTFRLLFDHMEIKLAEAIGNTTDPIVKLKALIQVSYKEFLVHSGDLVGIMMDFWAEGIRTKSTDVISLVNLEQMYSEYKMLIADILYEGMSQGIFKQVDANSVAAIIVGAMDGVMLQWIMNKNAVDIDKISEVMVNTLLSGIQI